MPRKVFVAGEILTAADVNTNLMDQAVMSFAGTAARGSAIPSPVEGMAAYLNDQNILSLYDGSAWKNSLATTGGILQVVQTVKTDTFSSSSTSYVDVTGLSATITPSSGSSKIMVVTNSKFGPPSGNVIYNNLLRDSTAIFVGAAAGSRDTEVQAASGSGGFTQTIATHNIVFLDSPASTSALTYKIQMKVTGGTGYLNRTSDDTDSAAFGRPASSIMLLEVAG